MNPNLARLSEKARNLTHDPGVYLMKDKKGEIIYIGKAKKFKNGVSQYFQPNNPSHTEKVRRMVENVEDFDYIVVGSEFEALVLECSLIKQNAPKYNILLKDDKGYHYIRVEKGPYPRITAQKQLLKDDGADYLGPYTSSYSVTQTVDEVNKIFGLPTCNKKFPQEFRKTRPCLNYHIKQCMAYAAAESARPSTVRYSTRRWPISKRAAAPCSAVWRSKWRRRRRRLTLNAPHVSATASAQSGISRTRRRFFLSTAESRTSSPSRRI